MQPEQILKRGKNNRLLIFKNQLAKSQKRTLFFFWQTIGLVGDAGIKYWQQGLIH